MLIITIARIIIPIKSHGRYSEIMPLRFREVQIKFLSGGREFSRMPTDINRNEWGLELAGIIERNRKYLSLLFFIIRKMIRELINLSYSPPKSFLNQLIIA